MGPYRPCWFLQYQFMRMSPNRKNCYPLLRLACGRLYTYRVFGVTQLANDISPIRKKGLGIVFL